MLLYGITLEPLAEDLRDADPTLLSTFYVNYAAFDGSMRRSVAQLRLLMDRGLGRGYLPETAKSIFIADNPEEKEAARREFEQAGLHLTYIDGSIYLGAYLGPMEELEAWMRTKVEAWDHRVRTLAKTAKRYNQLAYDSLGISLQLEWKYLQRNLPGFGSLMGPI